MTSAATCNVETLYDMFCFCAQGMAICWNSVFCGSFGALTAHEKPVSLILKDFVLEQMGNKTKWDLTNPGLPRKQPLIGDR